MNDQVLIPVKADEVARFSCNEKLKVMKLEKKAKFSWITIRNILLKFYFQRKISKTLSIRSSLCLVPSV